MCVLCSKTFPSGDFCLTFNFTTISILTLKGHYITTSEFQNNFMIYWYHKCNLFPVSSPCPCLCRSLWLPSYPWGQGISSQELPLTSPVWDPCHSLSQLHKGSPVKPWAFMNSVFCTKQLLPDCVAFTIFKRFSFFWQNYIKTKPGPYLPSIALKGCFQTIPAFVHSSFFIVNLSQAVNFGPTTGRLALRKKTRPCSVCARRVNGPLIAVETE